MNKFLASSLGYLNGIAAALTIGIGTLVLTPFFRTALNADQTMSIVVAALASAFIAIFSFGFLALLVQMHRELASIRSALERGARA
jgi:hypothetical protein